ncbi:MAG TPA: chitobiase/beta-hexosaminidase C-terminal domain-containing protein [Opitutaceae bacterium]|nr:chitobiase/beta-hexosaminidase C-terminal domain-containing protein [Opitutaceae bacterium]
MKRHKPLVPPQDSVTGPPIDKAGQAFASFFRPLAPASPGFLGRTLALSLALLAGASSAPAWQMKQAPLMTQWAAQVDPNNVLPAYPRPQMTRTNWLNLNGIWQFQAGAVNDPVPVGKTLAGDILVPFPVESAISGVMTHDDRAWYRRTFTIPTGWKGQHVLLNFGAVDWEAQIYVNGKSVGLHQGGYDAFSYDITSFLKSSGTQELIVRIFDPVDQGGEPRGKQTLNPGGIFYTSASGIWQTVWLEPVPTSTFVNSLVLVPDVDGNQLKLTAVLTGSTSGVSIKATALSNGTKVSSATGSPGKTLLLSVPNPKLWSPSQPFLYDLQISVIKNGTTIDTIGSYFGMRKVQVAASSGFQKILLNNQFIYEAGVLDQGYWPDGIYTAPTDAALESDLLSAQAFGFNLVRKHMKVEPARWYYWADKLGLLVWQDMPQGGNATAQDQQQFQLELGRMVTTHQNSPSIIMWTVFNEGWGEFNDVALTNWVMGLDPSRLVSDASGWVDNGAGNILDWHNYPSPAAPSDPTRAVASGEYGGIGLLVPGHDWNPSNPMSQATAANAADLEYQFEADAADLYDFKTYQGLSASVFTQLTDVEDEISGLMTYDRAVVKPNTANIAAINSAVVQGSFASTNVLPTSEVTAQTWLYTTATPAANWSDSGFDDSAWSSGPGSFGAGEGTPGTLWNSSDIWLRQNFVVPTLPASSQLFLQLWHDDDVQVYLNGVFAFSATGYVTAYGIYPIAPAALATLVPGLNNVIAVHCVNKGGPQYIDVGISSLSVSGSGGTVAAPSFSPGAGTYSTAQTVSINDSTSGASIRYTTDGSTPSETAGTLYTGSISISTTTTLKAMAFKNGMTDSTVTTGTYTITPPQVAAPTFSPPAGTFTSAQTVTITSSTSGALIAYTTDGSTPTESGGTVTHGTVLANGGTVTISVTTTLNALAFKGGTPDSTVTTGSYTIGTPQAAAPTFTPPTGTYTSPQTVTISTTTSGASIRYTTDGSTPSETTGTLYSSPVNISVTTTLNAMAFKTGMTDSTVTTGIYTISVVTRSLAGTSSDGWHALALTSAQAGTFTATFDATPTVSPENAVVGLSKGVATAYTGLSCIARFNTSGQIDAYNGTAYGTSTISYAKNITYHFRLVVNVTAHTYSVYVTPAGGTELTVGLNYVFRVAQASLDTWDLDVNSTPSGCSLTANSLNP